MARHLPVDISSVKSAARSPWTVMAGRVLGFNAETLLAVLRAVRGTSRMIEPAFCRFSQNESGERGSHQVQIVIEGEEVHNL